MSIAYYLYNQEVNFLKISLPAQGVVIGLAEHVDSESNDSAYSPVVEFTTKKGETSQFESNIQSNPPSYRKGDQVPVLYDPSNPSRAHIDSPWDSWLTCGIIGGIGGIFFIVTIFISFAKPEPNLNMQNNQGTTNFR